MGPLKSIVSGFQRYIDFKGRSSRPEFWWFFLFVNVVLIIATVFDGVSPNNSPEDIGGAYLFSLLILTIPTLAVSVRRLHDINRTGWWVLLSIIPLLGFFILLFFNCARGTLGRNRFGYPNSSEYADVRGATPDPASSFPSSQDLENFTPQSAPKNETAPKTTTGSFFAKIGVALAGVLVVVATRGGDDILKYGDDVMRLSDDAARIGGAANAGMLPNVSRNSIKPETINRLRSYGINVPRTINYDKIKRVLELATDLPISDIIQFVGDYAEAQEIKDEAIMNYIDSFTRLSDAPVSVDAYPITSQSKIDSAGYLLQEYYEEGKIIGFSFTSSRQALPSLDSLIENNERRGWVTIKSSVTNPKLPNTTMRSLILFKSDYPKMHIALEDLTFLSGNMLCSQTIKGSLLIDRQSLPSHEQIASVKLLLDLFMSENEVLCEAYEYVDGVQWDVRSLTTNGYEYEELRETSRIDLNHSFVNWDVVRSFLSP